MIEEQHQVPISMYPLDIKCHPQQLLHQQQQQQQQQNSGITLNGTGNGRMLANVIQPTTITEALTSEVSGLLGSITNHHSESNNNNSSTTNNNNNNSSINNTNLNGSSMGNINRTNACNISCGRTSNSCCSSNNNNNNSNNNNGNLIENGCNHLQRQPSNIVMSSVACGYCCQPIQDRYIMRVVDISYHENCLKCTICSMRLVHSCFIRDGKLYCRLDYERLFIRNRCLGCGDKISSDEFVMRTLENVFHLKCFACVVCGIQLKKGEQYVVKQGQLFCRIDYEKEVEMLQGYDFYGDDLFPPKMDGRRGPKRPRTILNTQQRRAFKASFEISPKPCRKVRENLAKDTGLSLRIVQVWFQNQRAKVKKIQKKAKQEPNKGTSETDSQESDSSLAKIKDENQSDSESLESQFSCSEKARLIKEELQNENIPFNCVDTNKENCNKNNEPILNTILGLCNYATFQQLMSTPFGQSQQMLNPIDRLYSMQNSYFRPDEFEFASNGNKDLNEN